MNNRFVVLIFVSAFTGICSWDTNSGVPCIPGPPGVKGQKGYKGIRGKVGSNGVMGPVGEPILYDCPKAVEPYRRIARDVESCRGLPGQLGETGQKGDRGLVGLTGPPGPIRWSSCKYVDTFQSNQFYRRSIDSGLEPAGPPSYHELNDTLPVVGPPGLPGLRGYPGLPGDKGYPGLPGRKGIQGKIPS